MILASSLPHIVVCMTLRLIWTIRMLSTWLQRRKRIRLSDRVMLHWMLMVHLFVIMLSVVRMPTILLFLLLMLILSTYLHSRLHLFLQVWFHSWSMMMVTVRWWDVTWCVRQFHCFIMMLQSLVLVLRSRYVRIHVQWLQLRVMVLSSMLMLLQSVFSTIVQMMRSL